MVLGSFIPEGGPNQSRFLQCKGHCGTLYNGWDQMGNLLIGQKENCRYCLFMKTGKAFLFSHLSKFYCISLDHSHEIFFLSYVKKYYVLSVFKFIKKVNRIM